MNDFAEHLKSIRKARNLTQKQVAEGVGISERSYQNYEGSDLARPSFDMLWAMADFFDISADELMGRAWKPKKKGK